MRKTFVVGKLTGTSAHIRFIEARLPPSERPLLEVLLDSTRRPGSRGAGEAGASPTVH